MATDPLLARLARILEGQYTIEREIGRGGMATVYLARDQRHRREVAIKLLQPELTTAATAERFLREIEITAKLQHPHILTLIDSGARDGLVYYVMPHVVGESLRERLIWEKQCNIEQSVQVARQVAGALQHAHHHGVIHRDIKPENILLSAGQAMLADFGIARAIRDSGQATITAVGLPLGTPAYMSPEQVSGRGEIDHRSDIYSLGCVLYEMLAGRPPFVAATVGRVMQMHMTEEPAPIQTCRSAAPQALDGIVARAMAKEPEDRFQSAQELADALGLVEAAETLERATPTGPRRRITAPDGPAGAGFGSTPFSLKRLLVTGAGIGVLVIAALALRGSGGSDRPPAVDTAAGPDYLSSIGVKPLDAIGGDSASAMVSAGITEEISAQLSKIKRLKVISRTTMEAVNRKGWTTRTVADSLGIRYLIEGSVQRSGQELAVTLQLIDAVNDAHVWSESYRRPLRDILMLRETIATKVAEALAERVPTLRAAAAPAAASQNPAAVEAMARGVALQDAGSEPLILEAIAAFQVALELDSTYAAAAVELSNALRLYVNLGFSGERDPFQTLAESLRWAERAVQLDRTSAQAWAARGSSRFETGVPTEQALADLEQAAALAPADGRVRLSRAFALSRIGRHREALEDMRAAVALDPLNAATRGGGLALTALGARDYDLAASQAMLAADRDPGFAGWRVIAGVALMLGGKPEQCLALKLDDPGVPVTAMCLSRLGREPEAARLIDSLIPLAGRKAVSVYTLGFIGAYYATLGDAEAAIRWLRSAHELSPTAFDFRFYSSGLFDQVRDNPVFQRGLDQILARIRSRFS